jgi:N6-L-threonylcarbamoyladenine synthase
MIRLNNDTTILSLETSCDETAASVVQGGRRVLSNVVASQMEMHRRYGGIVPEVASRQHILSLKPVLEEALAVLPRGWADLDAVAATYGPGLSGALLTGLNAAKAIAWQRGLPLVGVNHLEAHIYANWLASRREPTPAGASQPLTDVPQFPLVALVVSGGHTLLVLLHDHGDYQVLGQTRDDAVGEAFDKVARMLDLGYPGGPAIEQRAAGVDTTMTLPRAWLRDSYDFSFSGVKTAVLHRVQARQARQTPVVPPRSERSSARRDVTGRRSLPVGDPDVLPLDAQFVSQMAYAFQESVVDVLVTKTVHAARQYDACEILLAGGVAANRRLRNALAARADVPVRYPPISLCTDNAAMVAAAAFYRFESGLQSGWDLDVQPNLKLGTA